jgi:ribonuclease HII
VKKPNTVFSKINYLDFSPAPIVGVDEVGRGCLAGPVFACAVSFKNYTSEELKKLISSEEHSLLDFKDSKLLSEIRRNHMAPLIKKLHWVGLGSATVEEVDELNILQAALLAMKRAVGELESIMKIPAGHILVDGNFKIPDLKRTQTCVIKGDQRVAPISAASIVAKVHRDQYMSQIAEQYPQYCWHKNKGYGSAEHKSSISKLGPTLHHRKSFRGVKEYVSSS